MSNFLIIALSYNMYKKQKLNINKDYSDMGNIFSKFMALICAALNSVNNLSFPCFI